MRVATCPKRNSSNKPYCTSASCPSNGRIASARPRRSGRGRSPRLGPRRARRPRTSRGSRRRAASWSRTTRCAGCLPFFPQLGRGVRRRAPDVFCCREAPHARRVDGRILRVNLRGRRGGRRAHEEVSGRVVPEEGARDAALADEDELFLRSAFASVLQAASARSNSNRAAAARLAAQ